MNRPSFSPSFSTALDSLTEPILTLFALALAALGTSTGAATFAWTAGALEVPGLTTGPPSRLLALVGFALGVCALIAAYAALYSVLSRKPQPPLEPY